MDSTLVQDRKETERAKPVRKQHCWYNKERGNCWYVS
jgi:hypothetical protein